jgi:DNA-binding winged helix-turn-helix (wHTH) protein
MEVSVGIDSGRYIFGNCRLEIAEQELYRDERPQTLTPTEFKFLMYCMNLGKKPIKADEIIRHFWGPPGTEANLNTILAQLYPKLGEEKLKKNRRYIQRGGGRFRFIADVKFESEIEPSPPVLDHTPPREPSPSTNPTEPNFEVQSGHYCILSRATNLALDVASAAIESGQSVQLWSVPGGVNNQRWRISTSDPGYFTLCAKHSDKCLDVSAAGRENGTGLIQHTPESLPNQQWKIERTPLGFYKLSARHSDQALDRDDRSFSCGAKLQMWDKNRWPNQDWDLVREDHLLLRQHFLVDAAGFLGTHAQPSRVALFFGLWLRPRPDGSRRHLADRRWRVWHRSRERTSKSPDPGNPAPTRRTAIPGVVGRGWQTGHGSRPERRWTRGR